VTERVRRLYRLVIVYPDGSDVPGWRPACWSDPAFLAKLTRKARRELARTEFRWPRERLFLSSSGAHRRAMLLHWYGAAVAVRPSDPVTWQLAPREGWEADGAMRWDAGVEVLAEKLDEYETGKIVRSLSEGGS
jgi:hypothetical protein